MTHHQRRSAFEVEAASIEEFLRLLRGREGAEASAQTPLGVTRWPVFVAPLREVTGSTYAFPKVTRDVVAAFAYGRDVVSYRRTVSSVVELPEVATDLAERQRIAYEQTRVEIVRGIEAANLWVPVYEGFLRYSTVTGEVGEK